MPQAHSDTDKISGRFPSWVPENARRYLTHVETGMPIRALARSGDVHASTILRQVRRLEARRDDPLVDGALRRLSRAIPGLGCGTRSDPPAPPGLPSRHQVEREARRILRRLCESGATLAVAREMERAVVVRDGPNGDPNRTASLDRDIAQVLALLEWIHSEDPGATIARYRITAAGRAALREMVLSEEGGKGPGLSEARPPFSHAPAAMDPVGETAGRITLGESPLVALSRRRGKDGHPFLSRELIAAGERLREDFEMARLPESDGGCEELLAGADERPGGDCRTVSRARSRIRAALTELGPGLGDVVLRCCCYLQGLEEAERRMGWSARSGKIVLRIALQRLRRHYDSDRAAPVEIG